VSNQEAGFGYFLRMGIWSELNHCKFWYRVLFYSYGWALRSMYLEVIGCGASVLGRKKASSIWEIFSHHFLFRLGT
jgi:hypothetical protein